MTSAKASSKDADVKQLMVQRKVHCGKDKHLGDLPIDCSSVDFDNGSYL